MRAGRPSERYVLTGPSGWIGQAMLAHLARHHNGRLPDRVMAFASSAREQVLPWGETLAVRPLDTITPADVADAHVIHLAYLTKEKADLLGDRAFDQINMGIDDAVLGAIAGAAPRSLFVASSGAAALAETGDDRHPYGLAKLRQEARFLEAASRLGVPAVVGRIFNLAGPYINKLSSYAIADFTQQALDTARIHIAAPHPVFRSFLHIDDLCALIRTAGDARIGRAQPVDLCGAEVVEMADVAAAVAGAVGGDIVIERGAVDWSAPSAYLGNFTHTRVLAMQLGIWPTPFSRQVADTVAWIGQRAERGAEIPCV